VVNQGQQKGVATPMGATPSRVSCWCVLPRAAGACSCALAVLANCSRRVLWRWIYAAGRHVVAWLYRPPHQLARLQTAHGAEGAERIVSLAWGATPFSSLLSTVASRLVSRSGSEVILSRSTLTIPPYSTGIKARYHNRVTPSHGRGFLRASGGWCPLARRQRRECAQHDQSARPAMRGRAKH
jgi:hypothetical protein